MRVISKRVTDDCLCLTGFAVLDRKRNRYRAPIAKEALRNEGMEKSTCYHTANLAAPTEM